MSDNVEDFFAHYGVPGMKWGRRRGRTTSSKSSSGKPAHPKAKSLTDAELRDRISRLKLEKEYKQLTTPAPTAGRKFIKGVLADSGKKIATQYAAEYGAKAVAKSIAFATAKAAAKSAVKR